MFFDVFFDSLFVRLALIFHLNQLVNGLKSSDLFS